MRWRQLGHFFSVDLLIAGARGWLRVPVNGQQKSGVNPWSSGSWGNAETLTHVFWLRSWESSATFWRHSKITRERRAGSGPQPLSLDTALTAMTLKRRGTTPLASKHGGPSIPSNWRINTDKIKEDERHVHRGSVPASTWASGNLFL